LDELTDRITAAVNSVTETLSEVSGTNCSYRVDVRAAGGGHIEHL